MATILHTFSRGIFASSVPRLGNCALLVVVLLLYLGPRTPTLAQQTFELTAPQIGVSSQALLWQDRLQIVGSDRRVTEYTRDARFDTPDRMWVGFFSREANQVILWPVSNNGGMQIGTIRGNSVEYRMSQMQIRAARAPVDQVVQRPTVPPVVPGGSGQLSGVGGLLAELAISKLFDAVSRRQQRADAQMLRIASYDARGAPWVLSRGNGMRLRTISNGSPSGADWWVAPAGPGYVRVESYDRGRVYAVTAGQRGALSLAPLSQDPTQLWRVTGSGRIANQFVLESAAYPGTCLAHQAGGGVAMQPITYAPNQLWSPFVAPTVPNFQPFWRSVSTEVVSNQPLTPAKLDLINTHRYALVVLLGDVRTGPAFQQIRVEPNTTTTVMLERDPGATIFETVEIRSFGGVWERKQYVTAIPPTALYDLSVYEEHLQSIAIDATGKSPQTIEDVNYVPKSVGWLPLPAQLPDHSHLDLYARAKAARNPGAVRRMDPKQFDEQPSSNPLEDLLEKYQGSPRRKF